MFKVSHSIQEFPLLEINNVSDILRSVEETKDIALIISKQIIENKKEASTAVTCAATLPRPLLLRSRFPSDSSSVDQVLVFHRLLWQVLNSGLCNSSATLS
jgi:hypothetical protein